MAFAVICGQMMVEQREEMSFCHSDKNLAWQGRTKDASDRFTHWLSANCVEISQRTAYRWMAAAVRVMGLLLESHHTDPQVWIELDGDRFYLSMVLTRLDSECSPGMLTFRATFAKFLENKTLTEAAHATLAGADEESRITRAGNGSGKGGHNGDDRKDWPTFVAHNLHDFSMHLVRWNSMNETQQAELKVIVRNFILGDEVKLTGRKESIVQPGYERRDGKIVKCPWPEELCRAMQESLRERLRKTQ